MPKVKHYTSYQPNGYTHELSELDWKIIQVLQEKRQPFYHDVDLMPLVGCMDGFTVARALYYLKRGYLIRSLGISSVFVNGVLQNKESYCLVYGEHFELEGVSGD